MKNYHNFSKSIKDRRKTRKINLQTLAKEIGVSASTICRVERGDIVDIGTFFLGCKWLGISPNFFIWEED